MLFGNYTFAFAVCIMFYLDISDNFSSSTCDDQLDLFLNPYYGMNNTIIIIDNVYNSIIGQMSKLSTTKVLEIVLAYWK